MAEDGKLGRPKRAVRKYEPGLGEAVIERSADRFLFKLFLLVFLGSGCVAGYLLFHRQYLASYWWAAAASFLIPLIVGVLMLRPMFKKVDPQRIGWLFGVLITFGLGFWLGASAN